MSRRVDVTDEARREIDAAFEYIEQRSPRLAVDWFNNCLAAIRSLEEFAERCPRARESSVFPGEVRQLLFGRYRILYSITPTTVYVLHVRHGAMRPLMTDDD